VIANPAGPSRHIQNRNAMLWLYPGAFGVKTGYTSAAGECLITAAIRKGRTLVSVVLGDDGDAVFDDSASLLNYGFDAFTRSTVVRRWDPAGSARIDGADVQGLAGATLVRLVRSDRLDGLRVVLRARPGISLPVVAGRVIGLAVVIDHGQMVGSVPAVAAASVLAPPPPPTPAPPRIGPPAPPDGPLGVLLTLLRSTFGPIL
jgi:D-alanyl-D-alanine carboxypeptidase (penicillin-binding protein 5/6)